MISRNLHRALAALVIIGGATACKKEEPASGGTAGSAAAPTAGSAAAPTAGSAAAAAADTPTEPAATSPVIGKPAPDFTLETLDGQQVTLSSFKGKVVVLEWFNPGCPFVVKAHTKGSLVDTARTHTEAGGVWLAINSGAPGKQGHDPAENQAAATQWAMGHPILRDVSGEVGKAYGATNTPNMFVIDASGTVVYAGAIDNSPDGEGGSPRGGTLVNHVAAALADLAAGRPVATPVTRPYGCSVKYAS